MESHYIFQILEFLSTKKYMGKNYIKILLKMFPNITSGRKNFRYFESRIKKNLILSDKYHKKKNNLNIK